MSVALYTEAVKPAEELTVFDCSLGLGAAGPATIDHIRQSVAE